jgi:hypothetical protein
MLLAKLLLTAAIPDIPHWVAQEIAKVEHRRRQVEAGHRLERKCSTNNPVFIVNPNPDGWGHI